MRIIIVELGQIYKLGLAEKKIPKAFWAYAQKKMLNVETFKQLQLFQIIALQKILQVIVTNLILNNNKLLTQLTLVSIYKLPTIIKS